MPWGGSAADPGATPIPPAAPLSDRLAAALDREPSVRLPGRLKTDKPLVRAGMMRRLAASRLFAYGDRAGVLRAAAARSRRPFRLDVRQRVVVKALVSRHVGAGAARGAGLARHVGYLSRIGAGQDGARGEFFDARSDGVDAAARTAEWAPHRHHFRFIISPEHGDRLHDLKAYTREVMRRVTADLGEWDLPWVAVCHFDTDQPHAHVLAPGRRADGRDLVIPRDYVGYGFRARAQEVAQERLGDLSRADAERRIWKETQADRLTSFDRRLLAAADGRGMVEDAAGRSDAWAALTRGRLAHLERLGLATRVGRGYRLAPDMDQQLRRLQQSRDVIRTLNARRLAGGRAAVAETGLVRGRVAAAGFHDELGAAPWAVLSRPDGVEQYVRLTPGAPLPAVGRPLSLMVDPRGVGRVMAGPSRAASRGRGD